jgi:hypothetical protein
MPVNIFEFCFDLAETFMKKRKLFTDNPRKSELSVNYTVESMPFRMIICRKSKPSADNTSESFVFLINISDKSKQNSETFRRIIRRK